MEFDIGRERSFDGAGAGRWHGDVPHLHIPRQNDPYFDPEILNDVVAETGDVGSEAPDGDMPAREGCSPDLPVVGAADWRDTTEIKFTTLQHAADSRDMPRVALTGRIKDVAISRSFCVVVGDEGEVEIQQQFSAEVMTLDGEGLRKEIGVFAGWALNRLIDNPDSLLFNGLVQALVGSALTSPVSHFDHVTETAGRLQVATIDCDNVVTGDRPSVKLTERRKEESATMKLARLLPGNRRLTQSLAVVLGRPDNPGARQDFVAAADAATTRLGDADVMDAVDADGRTSRTSLRTHWNSITADGVIAAVIGRGTETTRHVQVTVDEIAVTGVWPASVYLEGDRTIEWYQLYWHLLKPPFGRR